MAESTFTARWSLVSKVASKARSSHCISVTHDGLVLLYGGELLPRTPVDTASVIASDHDQSMVLKGSVHAFDLKNALRSQKEGSSALGRWAMLQPDPATSLSSTSVSSLIPEPRVGATTVWDQTTERLFLWGGRGGVDMAPLPHEQCGLWEGSMDIDEAGGEILWERVKAVNGGDTPEPRSYHAAVASEGKIYIHAGCPTSGRLSTLDSFDLTTKAWVSLAPAPPPERGGTVLALVNNLKGLEGSAILRFGGFAGYELPLDNALDIYSTVSNTWRTVVPSPDSTYGHPGPRSVHGFVPFSSPSPALKDAVALLYHGEKDASKLGHAGAGAFWDDVWLLISTPTASGADAFGGFAWKKVGVLGNAEEKPEGRGWFASACLIDSDGATKAIMFGGLLHNNERSEEGWVLEIESKTQMTPTDDAKTTGDDDE